MKTIITIVFLIIICFQVSAQEATILLSNSPASTKDKRIVQIKILYSEIFFKEGVNIYRKNISSGDWEKITPTPLKKSEMPESQLDSSETKALFYALSTETPKDDDGKKYADFMRVSALMINNEFAGLYGVYYEDTGAADNNTYIYKIARLEAGREIEVSESEPIKVGEYIKSAPPASLYCKREHNHVLINWKKNDKFFTWNIYRRDLMNSYIRINEAPVMIFDQANINMDSASFFTDTSITEGNTYFYKIAGVDFFGNESDFSGDFKLDVLDLTPPPRVNEVKYEINNYDVKLTWNYENLPADFKEFNVLRGSDLDSPLYKINMETINFNQKTYADRVNKLNKVYYYIIETRDLNDNVSLSNMVIVNVSDGIPPGKPKIISAVGDTGRIYLKFDRPLEEDFWGYKLFRSLTPKDEDFMLLNSQPVTDLEFIDTLDKTSQVFYYYKIRALDSAYNESEYSDLIIVRMKDVLPPSKPFIKNIKVSENSITLEWLPNSDLDLVGYIIFRSTENDTAKWEMLTSSVLNTGEVSYSDKTLSPGIKYFYSLAAIDSNNNLSEKSDPYPGIIANNKLPEAVSDGILEYKAEDNSVNIKWTCEENKDLMGFAVFRREENSVEYLAISSLIKEYSFIDKNLDKGKSYYYIIKSYLNNGNNVRSNEYKVEIK